MNIFEGKLLGKDLSFGIIVSRFNDTISSKLLDGCHDCLTRHGTNSDNIDVYKVPGSFEIPLVAKKLTKQNKYNAIICLGAVIRGETPHFDYVSAEVSKGIASVSLETETPVIFGVLTTDTVEQALDRCGLKSGNKGYDAGLTALEITNLL